MGSLRDPKTLIKYPFLEEAQELAPRQMEESTDEFLSRICGAVALDRAKDRVIAALTSKEDYKVENTQKLETELEISSYALARMLVSCIGDRSLIDRLARYEAERASYFLENEDAEIKRSIADKLQIDPDATTMPVVNYVELVPHLRDSRWRLVNRNVQQGNVNLNPKELDELIRERIRIIIVDRLPLSVPSGICERLATASSEIVALRQQQALEQYGEIKEEAFPPCINALIRAISEGTNLTHMGRFAITSFLRTIGKDVTAIAEVFARAPDFDVEKTMYQVEHISGRGGTEYTPPSCATMRTFGLCANRDKDCERVNHPLSYYRLKKNVKKRRG